MAQQRWNSYVSPFQEMSYAVKCFVQNVRGPVSNIRERAFGQWYKDLGIYRFENEESTALPRLVGAAYGRVLEIGASTGNQVSRLDKTKIDHVFGVEPNNVMVDVLKAKIAELEIDDIYTPVICGIEDFEQLKTLGIVEGSVDTILSIQVLCSIPDAESVLKSLYKLLKPGGQLVFFEHQKSQDFVSRIVQHLWSWPWSFAMGGCRLDCDTERHLMNAGSWKVAEIDGDRMAWLLFPRVWGVLVKVGDDEKP